MKAFEFFDEKNKTRVQTVKQRLAGQREVIEDATSLLNYFKDTMETKFTQEQLQQQAAGTSLPGLTGGFRRTSTIVSQVLSKPQYASYHESGTINSSSINAEQEHTATEMVKRLSSSKNSPKSRGLPGLSGGKLSNNHLESM